MSFRILVAEDNEINQKLVSAMLKKGGYDFRLVLNGLEAVDSIRSEHFDLILMDCQMPELDGLQASLKIREFETLQNLQRVPIIALTANSMKGDRENCLNHQMDDFLSKPFKMNDLFDVLEKWSKKR